MIFQSSLPPEKKMTRHLIWVNSPGSHGRLYLSRTSKPPYVKLVRDMSKGQVFTSLRRAMETLSRVSARWPGARICDFDQESARLLCRMTGTGKYVPGTDECSCNEEAPGIQNSGIEMLADIANF